MGLGSGEWKIVFVYFFIFEKYALLTLIPGVVFALWVPGDIDRPELSYTLIVALDILPTLTG